MCARGVDLVCVRGCRGGEQEGVPDGEGVKATCPDLIRGTRILADGNGAAQSRAHGAVGGQGGVRARCDEAWRGRS